MNERENLFYFATKELSQDAFLRWLFESYNYNDVELKEVVESLLKSFCGFTDVDVANIEKIETEAQWCHIDIRVNITLKSGEQYALFIEDKTTSGEHNQLQTYDDKIAEYLNKALKNPSEEEKNIKLIKPKKVFYKTSTIGKEEEARIDSANEKNKNANNRPEIYKNEKWERFDFDKIHELFSPFRETENVILKQYIEHLEMIHTAKQSTQKPSGNSDWLDFLKWEAYFKYIGGDIEKDHPKGGVWKAGQYPYICLVLKRAENEPYMEIRSRDCLNGNFAARILCYGMEWMVDTTKSKAVDIHEEAEYKAIWNRRRDAQQCMIDTISNNADSSSGYVPGEKSRKSKVCPRQIGVYSAKNINSDDDFKSEFEKCGKWFDELMTKWDESMNSSAN